MEYSLTDPTGFVFQFASLNSMFSFIRGRGELDGWIIRVHHM